MKVGSKAVMKFRDTKPLPSEITDERVNNATLPVKIETARRAIAACTDLPELLRYRDQAEGLAAAVRTMKQVGPEMIRNANCLMADAWRKGGELLGAYSNVGPHTGGLNGGSTRSARTRVAAELGLSAAEVSNLVRVAKAPLQAVHTAAQKTRNLHIAAKVMPTVSGKKSALRYSTAVREVFGGGVASNLGLVSVLSVLRCLDLANFKLLTVDERKVVKAKITEIVELLDEMDRLCR